MDEGKMIEIVTQMFLDDEIDLDMYRRAIGDITTIYPYNRVLFGCYEYEYDKKEEFKACVLNVAKRYNPPHGVQEDDDIRVVVA